MKEEFIYRCPKCGNIEYFIEEGTARVKEKTRYSMRDGKIYCESIESEIGEIYNTEITCALCGEKF